MYICVCVFVRFCSCECVTGVTLMGFVHYLGGAIVKGNGGAQMGIFVHQGDTLLHIYIYTYIHICIHIG